MTSHRQIAILILAAGESSRMHLPKQLLPYRKTTLLRHTIDVAAASKALFVSVVLGANADQISKHILDSRIQIVMNDEWQTGLSSSIRAGIRSLPGSVDAAIIALCDQPKIQSSIFDALIDEFQSTQKPIVVCRYEHTFGVPALFSRNYFRQLMSLQGKDGARRIIQEHPDDVASIPFVGGHIDIDTPDDYQRLIEKEES
jgi:molybdenum cofactor cytidylyltransferase